MAHFYGTIQGNRGEASRLGSKDSGLRAHIASWAGAVSVQLYHNDATGVDMARVSLARHHGAGVERVLYDGPVSGDTRKRRGPSKILQQYLPGGLLTPAEGSAE